MPRLRDRIPDPRPSRAHPEHRKVRKEIEKENGFAWVPPIVLGLLGLTLAYDVTKDVQKHEERHKKEEEDAERRRRRRRDGSPRQRRRRSHDDEGIDRRRRRDDYDDYDDNYNNEDQRRWVKPDDIDIRNDYEGMGGGRDAGMERAESVERGEAYDAKYDGGLDRADQLEKGEGGGYDERARYGSRPRRAIAYDEPDDGRRYRRQRDADVDYEYLDYSRGRRELDERRSRPRTLRRRSSDW